MLARLKLILFLVSGDLTKGITAINEAAPIIYQLILLYQEAKTKGWMNANTALATEIKAATDDQTRQALAARLFSSRAGN